MNVKHPIAWNLSLYNADETTLHSHLLHTQVKAALNDVNDIHITAKTKESRSFQRLPVKKRPYLEMMNEFECSNDDMGSCDPPPTKLRRLVASCWNDTPDFHQYDTITEYNECYSPNWKEITKRPPSSGPYVYNETYLEDHAHDAASSQMAVDMDDPIHCDENDQICNDENTYASKTKMPTESRVPAVHSSPLNSETQPVELSFESDEEMEKKPAAILHYTRDAHRTNHHEYVEDEESIALAPLGPSRRTTAAHDALFSMSPKPGSFDDPKLLDLGLSIQASTTMVKPTMEHLSVPLTKLSRKDNSSRLGHDSMSYSTDETEQVQRPLPYMNATMLPKQAPSVLSDTDDEEELLLMTNTWTSPASTTMTVGPHTSSSAYLHGIALPSVTPSPNVLQQQQNSLTEPKHATPISAVHKLHRPLNAIDHVIRPTPRKPPPPSIKTEDMIENDFLNQVGNLLSPQGRVTNKPPVLSHHNDDRYNAFQPVTKRNNYHELHNIISGLVHEDGTSQSAANLSPPIVTTPNRHIPKVPYKSPFKPIPFKEFDNLSHHQIYMDHKGASNNGQVLRPIPRLSPMPTKWKTFQVARDSIHHDAVMTTPKPPPDVNHSAEPMEWEHPLRQDTTAMIMNGFAPTPPRYDIHFTMNGPSKIGPPVPSEVVVVPTTYMTTTKSHSKSDTSPVKSTPPKSTVYHLSSPNLASTSCILTPKVTTPIRHIYASRVNASTVMPTKKPHLTMAPYVIQNSPTTRFAPVKVNMNHTSRTTTPYVPPAPIEGNATFGWDGMMHTMNSNNNYNVKLPSSQRHFASAFAPGQRGYYQHPPSFDTPKDEYSSPHHRTTTSGTAGAPLLGATGTNHDFREPNSNINCMSSCSSSSLSNSTLFGGNSSSKNKRPIDYEQHEV